MDINAEKCLSNGSNPGLGYRVDEERRFHIDPEGAAVVREIFEQYASGKTVTEIIQSLNARQIKTSQEKRSTRIACIVCCGTDGISATTSTKGGNSKWDAPNFGGRVV